MYDLLLNEVETMTADSVRAFLRENLPLERLRPGANSVDAMAVWRGMAELGWFGVGLPEAAGGAGMGLTGEVLIHRECGRHLVTPLVLATTMACHVAVAAGDTALAERFATGAAVASVAIAPSGDQASFYLLDGSEADFLVAWGDWGMGLFANAAFGERVGEDCVDDSIALTTGKLSHQDALHVVPPGSAPLEQRAHVLLAASLTGLASAACELATGYAGLREQFGKPIGSFQAIKHRCADMAVRQRLAWYQTCLAALKLQAGAADAPLQVASALLLASEAARENGRACIQIHGGIGFQAECDAHWFIKRAFVYDLAGGGEQLQAERILAALEPAW